MWGTQAHLRSHLRRKVSLCYYCVVAGSWAGCWSLGWCVCVCCVVQRRTARRGIPSDGSASCCVVPMVRRSNYLGLNTFGTLGHTCFALPEQPPCAPCFARTHSNSISAWTCNKSSIPTRSSIKVIGVIIGNIMPPHYRRHQRI